ncbi:type III PLP-dependent enzyme domain-containing protein [Nguyenibacter vanlangensis]|uniref:PLP-dependent decarboxylase n=1 Tax=Nguyenibacter vanlangensis TaxID=1216886 RepID=A0A7Y7IT16_9PROT|nr:PLP-dependent decarboxylase [Nguyenibacter vanlangensis]NVN09782.1 PLP-dependent decarboxylase [Nguyenibacter vanlangensis]
MNAVTRIPPPPMTTSTKISTPAYIFDPERVIENYTALRSRLGTRLIVSVKANPNFELLQRCAHAFEDGVDIASLGELDLVVGRVRCERYINTPAWDNTLLRGAIASRATLIVDDITQAKTLAEVAGAGSTIRPVLMRVNVESLIEPLSGHGPDHFGMNRDTLVQAARVLSDAGIKVRGLHAFGGSHSFVPRGIALAQAMPKLVDLIEATTGRKLEFVNLGGGFPRDWRKLDFGPYLEAITPLAQRLTVAHESGRAIFGDAGQYLTRILAVKEFDDRIVAVCDGGMAQNFLLAQTEAAYRNFQAPRAVARAGASLTQANKPVTLTGSSCNRQDRIGKLGPEADRPAVGDLYAFEGCGAYNATYTVASFLSLRQARVYIGNMLS